MKDNRGFTLVELIIIMAIMAIITIGTSIGFKMLSFGSVKSTTERINSMLDYVQMENMSKSKTYYMVIEKETDGYYYISIEIDNPGTRQVQSKEKLDLKQGDISFHNRNDANIYLISNVPVDGRNVRDRVEVGFLKDTGGIRKNMYMGMEETVEGITVSSSGRTNIIRLVEATGKHYID